jgi:hypothetical protein
MQTGFTTESLHDVYGLRSLDEAGGGLSQSVERWLLAQVPRTAREESSSTAHTAS